MDTADVKEIIELDEDIVEFDSEENVGNVGNVGNIGNIGNI